MNQILKYIPILLLFIIGCSKKDYSPYTYENESTIYSDTKSTKFSQLVILLKPYILVENEKKYLVTDTIKNISININNKLWGVFNSFALDTSIFEKEKLTNYFATNTITKYSVIAPYKTNSDTLTTAGDYADLLNEFLTLEPGNYICQIVSFEIKKMNGEVKLIKPFLLVPIEIKENTISAFVGEFEVPINNN